MGLHTRNHCGPLDTIMGVATGGGGWGDMSPRFRILGGMSPPEIEIFKDFFLNIYQKFQRFQKVGIFRYFRNKVGEIQGEVGI